jgi:hypothetical protein
VSINLGRRPKKGLGPGRKPKASLNLGVKLKVVLNLGRNQQEMLSLGTKAVSVRKNLDLSPRLRTGIVLSSSKEAVEPRAGGNRAAINDEVKAKCVSGNSGHGREDCRDHTESGG